MSYPAALQELIDEFAEIDDKMEILEYVYDLADEVVDFPVENWNEKTRVLGCQSEAHLEVGVSDEIVELRSGADAKIVQGMMGIITIAINGRKAQDVLQLKPDFAQEMGILNSLSPSRSNGFRNIFDKVMAEIRMKQ
ncbi:MAG: SufE family protein [Candidatus Poseidoniaceae archaeon]|jgi:cysteine desulfuration protein SufE|nr:SufE family protein [Candidatus Poseidoniaceae archaeon]